jgi:hypothetical protein
VVHRTKWGFGERMAIARFSGRGHRFVTLDGLLQPPTAREGANPA